MGDVFYVTSQEPKVEVAGVLNAPWAPDPILGYDVVMSRLTAPQRAKLYQITAGVLVGELFAPAECVEFLGP